MADRSPSLRAGQTGAPEPAFPGREHPIALTIAGFDPSSGAGITADLKTFAAHNVYGMACISAMTVQSTLTVRSIAPLEVELIRQTLDCLMEDVLFSGIKIGMLATSGIVREVSAFLARSAVSRRRVVLDPVLRSSSGAALIDSQGVHALREELLPHVGWMTPNLMELAALTGVDRIGREEVPSAAHRLREMANRTGNPELTVVVTGGHLDSPDDFLLEASGESSWHRGVRVHTDATHGTGCAFSSALLCRLIAGDRPDAALAGAKAYVAAALRAAYPIGKGKGPMNHLFLSGNY